MRSGRLRALHFTPLPLGSIRPAGWLAAQLRLQADGISGHLDEFWPDVRDSRWFGGEAEGWERAPYWLDGVLPLAYLLDDQALQEKVSGHVDKILAGQEEDGWLGPRQSFIKETDQPRYDLWAQFLALKVLVQHHDATGDPRVPGAVARSLACIDRIIDTQSLFDWGQFRWFEALIAIYWLYERTGETWLPDLAVKLHAQGFDWAACFARWPYAAPTPQGRWNFTSHVVNNAMALKAHALWWRLSSHAADRHAVYTMLEQLDAHHGMATGIFTGDECLAGLSPTQGTELCAVVEAQYSLEWLLALLGDPAFGDRLESITYNALPATFSPDMWSHQYDQQINQIECSIRPDWPWNTNGPESNIFGVEPNYGCCTANLSQGWPKFVAHLWMATRDGGLAAVAHGPSSVQAQLAHGPVQIRVETDYPFADTLTYHVETSGDAAFPLLLRIPAWAEGATVTLPDGRVEAAAPGAFHTVRRTWQSGDQVRLTLPQQPRLLARPGGAVALARGPLLYALPLGEEWRRVHADQPYRELPHADWEIHPTTAWNYGLALTPEGLAAQVQVAEAAVTARPFDPANAPVALTVPGRPVADWQAVGGMAGPIPCGPVAAQGPEESLTLIPYGCTNLRIAEFPLVHGK